MLPSQNSRNRLGLKTFVVFALQRSHPVFVGVIVFVGIKLLRPYIGGAMASTSITEQYAKTFNNIIDFAALGGLAVAAIGLAFALIIAWLEYITYHFELGDHAIHIRRGIFYKVETAIPYRQIQNVNVVRDLFYQIIGLSQVVILTAGSEGDETNEGGDEPEGVLPALDNDVARALQAELLKRSNMERVMAVQQSQKPMEST